MKTKRWSKKRTPHAVFPRSRRGDASPRAWRTLPPCRAAHPAACCPGCRVAPGATAGRADSPAVLARLEQRPERRWWLRRTAARTRGSPRWGCSGGTASPRGGPAEPPPPPPGGASPQRERGNTACGVRFLLQRLLFTYFWAAPSTKSGVAQWLACWAHNPNVRGSKPRSANF